MNRIKNGFCVQPPNFDAKEFDIFNVQFNIHLVPEALYFTIESNHYDVG